MPHPLVWELAPEPDDYLTVYPLTRWIGEETKRDMPPYLYMYYKNQMKICRRRALRVSKLYSHTIPPQCVLFLLEKSIKFTKVDN